MNTATQNEKQNQGPASVDADKASHSNETGHSFFPKDKGKDFYPMNNRGYSGKMTIVKYDGGEIQAERWHNAAQHPAACTINVDKFVERYQCDPLEAHVFYPETFNEPVNRSSN